MMYWWCGSCQTIFTDVLGAKDTAAKLFPKLLNFRNKQNSLGHRSGNVKRQSRFEQNHDCMAMTLKSNTNHLNGSKKSKSSSIKCEGFVHCFLRLQWRSGSWILTTRSYVEQRILPWSYAPIASRIMEKPIMDFAPW